jgi:hypothetical protein
MEPRFKVISETTPPNPKANHGDTENTEVARTGAAEDV